MEHGPFIDDFPIQSYIYQGFSIVSHKQIVSIQ